MDDAQPTEAKPQLRNLNLAAVSLAFGLASIPLYPVIFCGVVAIIAGFFALKGIPKPRVGRNGRTMAVGGAILGFFSLTAGIFDLPTADIGKAKRTTSLAIAVALESSINSIYTEYGAIPNNGSRVTTESPEGRQLLSVLLGLDEKSDKPLNTRAIKFLSAREAKANRSSGLVYSGSGNSVEGLYDSWGNPFTVELDVDYDEELHFTIASKTIDLKGRRVAVYSPGEDKKLGTADDVRTW
jgi:Domain of unknown function (DUF4190)